MLATTHFHVFFRAEDEFANGFYLDSTAVNWQFSKINIFHLEHPWSPPSTTSSLVWRRQLNSIKKQQNIRQYFLIISDHKHKSTAITTTRLKSQMTFSSSNIRLPKKKKNQNNNVVIGTDQMTRRDDEDSSFDRIRKANSESRIVRVESWWEVTYAN